MKHKLRWLLIGWVAVILAFATTHISQAQTPTPTAASRADLVVDAMTIESETGASCGPIEATLGVRVIVSNVGEAAAGAFTVAVNGQSLAVSDLPAGQSAALFFAGYVVGAETRAVVDAADEVVEANETNNELALMLPVPTPVPTCTPTAPPPTFTPMPATATPTASPTVPSVAATAAVKLVPASLVAPVCSPQERTILSVSEVANLAFVTLSLRYDPAVVQVIDADPSQSGVQVMLNNSIVLNVFRNEVDPVQGRIDIDMELKSFAGQIDLLLIDWKPQSPGQSSLTFAELVLLDYDEIEIGRTFSNGSIEITSSCDTVRGTVLLQGRSDHSNIVVLGPSGQRTQTNAQGQFSLLSDLPLSIQHSHYLFGEAPVGAGQSIPKTEVEGNIIELGELTLLAGDINQDNIINIYDMVHLASRMSTADPTADLDGDGQVNIRDLALAATNYQLQGPLTEWSRE